jgi:hypothetical protein
MKTYTRCRTDHLRRRLAEITQRLASRLHCAYLVLGLVLLEVL